MTFEIGDRVRLKILPTYGGSPLRIDYEIGDAGTVTGYIDTRERTIGVQFDRPAPRYTDDDGRWSIDADCLELEVIPVTDEELAEIYKSLGVRDVPRR